MNSPWLRKLIVTIGPLEESDGAAAGSGNAGNSGDVIELVSDGTTDNLKITCEINKTVNGQPSPSTITIYNLSGGTRNRLQRSLTRITVKAGWNNVEPMQVFEGTIISCASEKQGAEITTKIQAQQGYGALVKAVTSTTFAPNSEIKDAVKELAQNLEGLTVNDSDLVGIKGKFGASGWSFAGMTKDALTQLANEKGFSWSVDDGMFRALGDTSSFEGIVKLNGQDGGLINVSPVVEGPMQVPKGVKIKAIFIPGVKPGASVAIQSSFAEDLDGEYRVHTAKYSLDPFSEAWTMDLDAFKEMSG